MEWSQFSTVKTCCGKCNYDQISAYINYSSFHKWCEGWYPASRGKLSFNTRQPKNNHWPEAFWPAASRLYILV